MQQFCVNFFLKSYTKEVETFYGRVLYRKYKVCSVARRSGTAEIPTHNAFCPTELFLSNIIRFTADQTTAAKARYVPVIVATGAR